MDGISLIVCTYNGSRRLPTTLGFIAKQIVNNNIPWEVIIVSNNSTDDTVEIAKSSWDQFQLNVPFQVLTEDTPGKENAILKGFDLAAFEFMSIVDDDNWLAPDYVNTAFEIMSKHPQIGILGALAIGEFEIQPPAWFSRFQAVYAVGPNGNGESGPLPRYNSYVFGAGSVTRKSAWRKIRQSGFVFTTSTKRGKILVSGEDVELGDAIQLAGYELWYDDRLSFRHFMFKERLNWPYLLRIGQGTASSSLTSVIYYFIFRHPDLTEKKFKFLYHKRLIWLVFQIFKQPRALFHFLFARENENHTDTFEMLRLVYNLKASFSQRHQALEVFRKVSQLRSNLLSLGHA